MKPTVGAIVVLGALLTFGTAAALLFGSCGRETTEVVMEGKTREEIVAQAREKLAASLSGLQDKVADTRCAFIIAVTESEQGEIEAAVTFVGEVRQPEKLGRALTACIEEVKRALRASGDCDCPDCRAAKAMAHAHAILRDAARASGPGSAPGSSPSSPHGPARDN
jgi:hypothetical protein